MEKSKKLSLLKWAVQSGKAELAEDPTMAKHQWKVDKDSEDQGGQETTAGEE